MKSIKNPDQVSPFLQAAIALDNHFNEVVSMSIQLNEADLETEYGLNHARKILGRFSETGENLGAAIMSLAQTLNDAKASAEMATHKIAERAQAVQARMQENDSIAARFRLLGDSMQNISASVNTLMGGKKNFTEQEKAEMTNAVPQIVSQLGVLFDEAGKIRDDARDANLKSLEKDAGSLHQSIRSMREKLSQCLVTH